MGLSIIGSSYSISRIAGFPYGGCLHKRFTNLFTIFLVYVAIAGWNLAPSFLSSLYHINRIPDKLIIDTLGYLRAPWHYIPSSFPAHSYYFFILLFALFALSFRFRPPRLLDHNKILVFIGTIVSLALIGTVFVEMIPIAFIMKLQLFRMTPYVILFCYIYISHHLSRRLFSSPSWIYVSFLYLIAASLVTRSPQPLSQVTLLVIYIIHEIFIALKIRTASAVSALVLIFNLANYFSQPGLIGTIQVRSLTNKEINRNQVFTWIRDHTPPDAIFVSPPLMNDFRFETNRATIVTFQATPLVRDNGMIEWRRRMFAVANLPDQYRVDTTMIYTGFKTLTEEDVKELQQKYSTNYLLTESDMILDFPVLFNNETFIVYSIS